MAEVTSQSREAASVVERIANWLAVWRRTLREIRVQAELAQKLKGVDDHLLRDMGLTRTGKRFAQIGDDWDRYR